MQLATCNALARGSTVQYAVATGGQQEPVCCDKVCNLRIARHDALSYQ